MTTINFDEIINRRGTQSAKHDLFDEDILPLWVADMDFPAPEPVIQALHERIDHRIFGYSMADPELKDVLCRRMADLYNWEIKPEDIIFLPGVVAGFKTAIRAFAQAGDNVLMQPPVYPPFLSAPKLSDQTAKFADLTAIQEGNRLRYEIDFDVFKNAIDERTKTFLLCNPHNPVGRVFSQDELTQMAEICVENDLVIISDDIHCDLLFDDHKHVPIASLSPEVAKHTVTIMAPSKTYNIPSMGFAFVVIQDEDLRKKFEAAAAILPHVGVMGYTAALAAYRDSQAWLDAALAYLQANRDFTTKFVEENLPGVAIVHPEGTYLSWLDCRQYIKSAENQGERADWIDPFFLKNAKVALNAGKMFGDCGAGFVRLNFGCPRATLEEALERIKAAIIK
jgi:cysteine-S-conjugate beta-lyase